MTGSPSPFRSALSLLFIIFLGLLVYSNTLHVPFVFDDIPNITGNLLIQNPSLFADPLRYCSQVPPGTEAAVACGTYKSRFVGYLTFAVNHRLHGLDVVGYHLTNIGIHIINGLLVYFLVLLTFRTPRLHGQGDTFGPSVALFTALLFVCHPIQTQAVTYIVQRFASLATLFYLLSLVMYIKSRLTQEQGKVEAKVKGDAKKYFAFAWYLLSFLSAVCAMKTKEMAFTLPLVISLYEFMFFEGKVLRRILFLMPLLLTMLIIPLSLVGIDRPLGEVIGDVSEATRVQTEMSRWDYLFTQFRVIVTYIRLIFVPVGQNLDYDYPVYYSFFDPGVFFSFLFLLSIFGLGVYCLYRSRITHHALRITAFGIFWFFITLSVESSIIPIQDVIFEHRLYLPSVGAFLAITAAVFLAGEKLKTRGQAAWKAIPVALSLILVVLAGAAYARNRVWQDDVTLWSDVVAKSPNNARAYNNLGIGYQKRNEMGKAMEMYKKATTLIPPFIDSYYNLGFVHFFFSRYDKGYYNLGIYYFKKGHYEEALRNYTKAIGANQNFGEVYNSRGIVYAAMGRYDDALSDYTRAMAIDPASAGPHNNRGVLYAGEGLYREALEDLDKAIGLDPNYADAYYNRGVVLARSARLDRASSDFRKACELGKKAGCEALKNPTSVF